MVETASQRAAGSIRRIEQGAPAEVERRRLGAAREMPRSELEAALAQALGSEDLAFAGELEVAIWQPAAPELDS